ncbi:hypothetical protein L0U88_03490 [Flavihumibacter sp. RY-1]|uniref:Sialate O-acetylesterase domain-containing protein n=1 Tax=Flavihumibacter fluminis TaxID=2909236 RepID=A0ABS9BF15_9BACT|nr:hypothetical protein [Flavihumibacter fluminis]
MRTIFLFLACLVTTVVAARVSIPGYYSDHMVLQRDQPIRLLGWADAGERVRVQLGNNSAVVKADRNGKWTVLLPALPAGGPFLLSFTGKNTIELKDVIIGDVWFCSGQSNMEWKLGWLEKEKAAIRSFDHPSIRIYTVPHLMAGKATVEVQGAQWLPCTPENAPAFSAVATYFARFLQQEKKVPIGIIVSAWGGTDIEPWISPGTLTQLEKHRAALDRLGSVGDPESYLQQSKESQQRWEDSLIHADLGGRENWKDPVTNDADWPTITAPAVWDVLGYKGEGVGWFRKSIELSGNDIKKPMLLSLGQVHNKAEVYVNGKLLDGPATIGKQQFYVVPASLFREGSNLIAAKVYKFWSYGGFIGKATDMYLLKPSGPLSLAGEWRFRPGFLSRNPMLFRGPNSYPASLFNSMVVPFTSFGLKGVIWYQGENNTSRPSDYAWHLQALVNDWRSHWKMPQLPFLVVQLPNFTAPPDRVGNYTLIRAAQQEAVTLPNVALAFTIDVGDSTDIHPVNKMDVGYRLNLLARKIAYGEEKLVASGPQIDSIEAQGARLLLSFNSTGSGLLTPDKYGLVKGFEIAGEDGRFHWARAFIMENKVVVYTEHVKVPVHVRYAWADNPDAGLFNKEGLPAAPFNRSIR